MSQRFLTLGFLSLCLTLTACSSSDDPIDDDLFDGGIAGADGGDGGDGGSGGMAGGSGGSGGGDGGSGGSAGDMSPDAGGDPSSPDAGGEPGDDLDAGVEPDASVEPDAGPGDEDDSLATGTFLKTIVSSSLTNVAILNTEGGRRYMSLLRAEDVAGSGNVTALRLQLGDDLNNAVTCPNTTIRVGHTTVTALDDTFADNVEQGAGSFVAVVDDASIEIPAGDSLDFFEIPFETPVYYNGTDNLIFEIARTAGCSAGVGIRLQANAGYTATIGSTESATAETASGSSNRPITAGFVFSGGDNKVLAADGTTHLTGYAPPISNGRGQYLILGSDIDGAGPITGIGFELSEPAPEPLTSIYTVTLSRVHTEKTALVDEFAENVGLEPTVVADGLTLHVQEGASEFWLPLSEVYFYNGIGNLLIDITASDATGGVQIRRRALTEARIVTGVAANQDGSTYARAMEPKLRFHGGTIDRVLGHATETTYVFPNIDNGRSQQILYLASELGTAGTVTKLACRMRTPTSTATDYPNFEVVMAHSEASELGTDLETNLLEPEIVYSGTFSLPAGLIEGDWVEIPLTTAFEYDGLRNLVIQTRSDAGAELHTCALYYDATRYENRILYGATQDATDGSPSHAQSDLRLWIEK